MHFAPSSVLAPSSKARSPYYRSCAFVVGDCILQASNVGTVWYAVWYGVTYLADNSHAQTSALKHPSFQKRPGSMRLSKAKGLDQI